MVLRTPTCATHTISPERDSTPECMEPPPRIHKQLLRGDLSASPAVRLTPGFLSPRNTAATASNPAEPAASPAPPMYATAARRAATGCATQATTSNGL